MTSLRSFDNVVWCDLEIVLLKIHSASTWDTKMVRVSTTPDQSKPTVNVYIMPREDDPIFDPPTTYREHVMRKGLYRGHHFGTPARLKIIDAHNIAFFHPDPGLIIWGLVTKYVLTIYAFQANMLHLKGGAVSYKGKAFLILGRGGSGKTEVVKALCKIGAKLMGNTHLLIDASRVCGIKSNMRVREQHRDVYVSTQPEVLEATPTWLPIGGVFWVKYRVDGRSFVDRLPTPYAKANVDLFSESIKNWELKEDVADFYKSDPFQFGEHLSRLDRLLSDFCERNEVYYLNLDVFSDSGADALSALIEADSLDEAAASLRS